MKAFIINSVEFRHWGWNAMTVAFIATVAFTFVQAWSLWIQAGTIWKKRSAESVSVPLFTFGCFACVGFAIYGYFIRSIATLASGGIQCLMYVPVVIGIIRFKRVRPYEWALVALFTAIGPLMAIVSRKDLFLFAIISVELFVLADQPYQIWKNKSAGAVNPKTMCVYLAACAFWTVYALMIHDWVLSVFNPLGVVILGTTLALWWRYRPESEYDAYQEFDAASPRAQ
ncbi:MAG: hypothetical protein KGI79_01680 [Patescibacteria group bacterium]|nr:hypothetical protein [Patescibacteria group bacterium]MDE2116567.1 hypothetical protein [Patescibacteria group bacterium]